MNEQQMQIPSAPVRHVFSAISAVTSDLSKVGIAKNRKNTDQHYSFRGIDDVYNALAPLLAKHKLVILPKVLQREYREGKSGQGKPLHFVTLTVEYQFVSAVDSSYVAVVAVGEGMDSSDKATNKAFSAAYKYAVMQAFAIPIEGTPDADAESPELGEGGGTAEAVAGAVVIGPEDVTQLRDRIKKMGSSEAKIVKFFEVENLESLTKTKARDLNSWLDEKEKAVADKRKSAGDSGTQG